MMTNHIDPTDEIGCEELPGFQDHEDELELMELGALVLADALRDLDPDGTSNL